VPLTVTAYAPLLCFFVMQQSGSADVCTAGSAHTRTAAAAGEGAAGATGGGTRAAAGPLEQYQHFNEQLLDEVLLSAPSGAAVHDSYNLQPGSAALTGNTPRRSPRLGAVGGNAQQLQQQAHGTFPFPALAQPPPQPAQQDQQQQQHQQQPPATGEGVAPAPGDVRRSDRQQQHLQQPLRKKLCRKRALRLQPTGLLAGMTTLSSRPCR
jgi:hypothetical protein